MHSITIKASLTYGTEVSILERRDSERNTNYIRVFKIINGYYKGTSSTKYTHQSKNQIFP